MEKLYIQSTLILFSSQSDNFFINNLKKNENDKVIVGYTYKPVSKILRFFRRIHMKSFECNQEIWYGEWKNIKRINTIILFDSIFNLNIVDFLKKKYPEARIIFWFWNPVKDEEKIKILKSKNIEVWSFDFNDCKKYNLKRNTQFFFEVDFDFKPLKDEKEKIYFIGTDKGRFLKITEILKEIKKTEKEIEVKIQILKDKGKKYSFVRNIDLLEKFIPYAKIIYEIKNATILLEICQNNQSGITLRALEALMFNKKLITNNKDIINYDFYKKENIYIIGESRSLGEFCDEKYKIIDNRIKEKYLFKTWIENFFYKDAF